MPLPHSGGRVVVGIDGSDTALGAARWATTVAARLGLPVHLVHSTLHPARLPGVGDPAMSERLREALAAEGTRMVTTAADALREWAPDVAVTTALDSESAAPALLAAATDAALVVVGATGRGSVERWLLGSTALRVARRAPCPVVVWRGDPDAPGPDTSPVVVGVDGSAVSTAATGTAFALADVLGAPLVAVRAWTDESAIGSATPDVLRLSGPTALLVDWDAVERSEAARLTDLLAPYRDRFPDVTVREVSARGSASRELLRALDDGQLAVVGSQGRGRVAGILLGSTSQNLLHRADRTIVIHHSRGDAVR